MQGASPLASPRLNLRGAGSTGAGGAMRYEPGAALVKGREQGIQRGACFLCSLPTLPFVYLPAPIPPTPFPAGRGRLYTLFRRGLTPPAPLRNKPARHWLRAGNRVPGGAWGAMGSGGEGGGIRRGVGGRWGRRGGKGCPVGHYFLFYTRFYARFRYKSS